MCVAMAKARGEDQQFLENHAWYDAHFEDLFKEYHGQYVAVNRGQVVGSSKDVAELARKTHDMTGVLIAKVVRPEEEKHYLL
jgi:DNA-binding phage protein